MKKELGKWLMDVAKYVLTAILLTTVFGGMENGLLIFLLGILIVISCLSLGLLMVADKKEKKRTNFNKRIISKR